MESKAAKADSLAAILRRSALAVGLGWIAAGGALLLNGGRRNQQDYSHSSWTPIDPSEYQADSD